jgi:hypothetical protein
MTTQAIQALQEKTHAVRSAARGFEDTAALALAAKFPPPDVPAADDEEIPDWRTLQRFIARRIEMERARLMEASRAHEREIHDDPRKREERDEAVQAAYEGFVRVRGVLERVVGKTETYALLGVKGRTPERPQTLLAHMCAAVPRLRDAERRPDTVDFPGMSLDWTALADALARDASRLDEALTLERHDRRRADLALIKKDRVQASVNDSYVGFAKILEGMYIAAGQRGLAARLRPTVPKAAKEERVEEVEEERVEVTAAETTHRPAAEAVNDETEAPGEAVVLPFVAAGARAAGRREPPGSSAESPDSQVPPEPEQLLRDLARLLGMEPQPVRRDPTPSASAGPPPGMEGDTA